MFHVFPYLFGRFADQHNLATTHLLWEKKNCNFAKIFKKYFKSKIWCHRNQKRVSAGLLFFL